MAIKQAVNSPRTQVQARISTDLHARMLAECGHCGCHVNGFIAIAIAHEVANRKKSRKEATDAYLETLATAIEGEANA